MQLHPVGVAKVGNLHPVQLLKPRPGCCRLGRRGACGRRVLGRVVQVVCDGAAEQDVLGLDVRVDDAALLVQEVQRLQDLARDVLDRGRRDAPVAVQLDEVEEIAPEELKDHARVCRQR